MKDETREFLLIFLVAFIIAIGLLFIYNKFEKSQTMPQIDFSNIENSNPDVEPYEPPVQQQMYGSNSYEQENANDLIEYGDDDYRQSSTTNRLPQADYNGLSGEDIDYHNTMRQAYGQALDQSQYPAGSYVRMSPEARRHMNRNRTSSVNGQVYFDASGNPVGGDAGGSSSSYSRSSTSNSRFSRDSKAEIHAHQEAQRNPTHYSIKRSQTYENNNNVKYGPRR